MSATSGGPKLLSLSLLNTIILYYKICFLILNIPALEARIDLSKLALVWSECVLLMRHAEFIVKLGALSLMWLKLCIWITSHTHIWVDVYVNILGDILNSIVVDCVRSLLLLT